MRKRPKRGRKGRVHEPKVIIMRMVSLCEIAGAKKKRRSRFGLKECRRWDSE
jgi:hypothetical protein